MKTRQAVLFTCVIGITLLFAGAGRTETTLCTEITILPATISTHGVYCLTSDIATDLTSGYAVTIAADDVVLDLNGHTIDNLAAGSGTQAYGIYGYRRKNVTVKNGTIRGFLGGVYFSDWGAYTDSRGHLIDRIRSDKNTSFGIAVKGHGSVIQGNQVMTTGGTTAYGSSASAYGIYALGPGNRIMDNDVITVTPTGSGTSYGILASSDNGIVFRNRVSDARYGIYMYTSSIKYRDNLTMDVTTPYNGGMDAGNND
jgi:parallel beta-helix repeat protein